MRVTASEVAAGAETEPVRVSLCALRAASAACIARSVPSYVLVLGP